jgi:MscS family membrane protein
MARFAKGILPKIARKALMPFLLLFLTVLLYDIYKLKIAPSLSPSLHNEIQKWCMTVFIISCSFILQRVAGALFQWYKETIADLTITRLDDELIPLLRRVVKIGIWIIATLIILPIFGFNISALVTTLGVASLAIALAAQDTIANVIAGFLLMIDKPFRIGDDIRLPTGERVTVLDIGVRRSRFLSEERSIIIAPNLDLSKSKIINYTYGSEYQSSSR